MVEDPSEPGQPARALARQAAFLERVQRIAKIGGWELDSRTNALSWTDETYRIHGVTRSNYAPSVETAIEFYTPETRPVIQRALKAASTQAVQYDLELHIVRKDGALR